MGVVEDKRERWKRRIAELRKEEAAEDNNNNEKDQGGVKKMELDGTEELQLLERKLEDEEARFKKSKEENIRRRHNYVPFIINMLQVLAKKGELVPMLEAAEKEQKAKEEQQANKN